MRKALLMAVAVAVALAFTGMVSAAEQTGQPAPKAGTETKAEAKAEAKHESVYLKLTDLTDKQKDEIKAIEKQAAVDADKATTKEDKQKVWKAADEKIRTKVLTEKQVKELNELQAKHHKGASSEPAGAKH